MRVLMGKLGERGFYFLDSMTTPESVGISEARRAGVPNARNRMFIDSPVDESGRIDVESQLAELAVVARKLGEAVGLGWRETTDALTQPYQVIKKMVLKELPVDSIGGRNRRIE